MKQRKLVQLVRKLNAQKKRPVSCMAVFILHTKYAHSAFIYHSDIQNIEIKRWNRTPNTQASEQIYTTINKKQTYRIIEVHHYSCNPYSKLIAHWKLSNISFTPNNPRSKTYIG
jgi:hypothetical protein